MADVPPNPPEPSAALLPFMAQHGRAWKATRRAPWIVSAFDLQRHGLDDVRAPSWLISLQSDAPPPLDFTAWAHPVLAVRCPSCGARPGSRCARPSGHQASDLHAARRAEADRVFAERHGPKASIELVDGRWTIDPLGRASIRPQPE